MIHVVVVFYCFSLLTDEESERKCVLKNYELKQQTDDFSFRQSSSTNEALLQTGVCVGVYGQYATNRCRKENHKKIEIHESSDTVYRLEKGKEPQWSSSGKRSMEWDAMGWEGEWYV